MLVRRVRQLDQGRVAHPTAILKNIDSRLIKEVLLLNFVHRVRSVLTNEGSYLIYDSGAALHGLYVISSRNTSSSTRNIRCSSRTPKLAPNHRKN